MTVDELAAAIGSFRYRYADERDLQDAIHEALDTLDYTVEREVRLNARCRIDMMVDGIGVEVKVDGTARDLERQAKRYLNTGIAGLVIVTTRVRHQVVQDDRVRVVSLAIAAL